MKYVKLFENINFDEFDVEEVWEEEEEQYKNGKLYIGKYNNVDYIQIINGVEEHIKRPRYEIFMYIDDSEGIDGYADGGDIGMYFDGNIGFYKLYDDDYDYYDGKYLTGKLLPIYDEYETIDNFLIMNKKEVSFIKRNRSILFFNDGEEIKLKEFENVYKQKLGFIKA